MLINMSCKLDCHFNMCWLVPRQSTELSKVDIATTTTDITISIFDSPPMDLPIFEVCFEHNRNCPGATCPSICTAHNLYNGLRITSSKGTMIRPASRPYK